MPYRVFGHDPCMVIGLLRWSQFRPAQVLVNFPEQPGVTVHVDDKGVTSFHAQVAHGGEAMKTRDQMTVVVVHEDVDRVL